MTNNGELTKYEEDEDYSKLPADHPSTWMGYRLKKHFI
jgi:hypothetical protein